MKRKFKYKRKRTLKQQVKFQFRNVLICIIVFLPIPLYIVGNLANMYSQGLNKFPYVHFNGLDPSSEVYISWETEEAQETTLWLGTDPDSLALQSTNSTSVQFHRVYIAGLAPDTPYYYRVGVNSPSPEYFGPLSTFRTAPVENKSFEVAIFSDSQQMWGIGHYESIVNQIKNDEDLAFVSCVGDIVQEGEVQDDWNLFLRQSHPWAKHTPFVPVIGNHDYDEAHPERSYYTQYFGYSYQSGPYSHNFYYTFNWSNVQFVIGEISTSSTRVSDDVFNVTLHDEWLNETLTRGQDKTFRILMFHRNLMTSTTSDGYLIDRVSAIAQDYNVSLALFGHNHHYERLFYQGHRYLCLGGGGGMQDGAFRIIPESEALSIGPSITKIRFNIDEMDVTTTSEQGDVIDHFTLVSSGTQAILKEGY
ncbi:MAG: metallophosphoesterase [Promethearchaeota archaeon]